MTLVGELLQPVLRGLILVFIFGTIVSEGRSAVSLNYVRQYVSLAAFFSVFLGFNNAFGIADRVKSGDIAYDLVRPRAWFVQMFCQYFGERVASSFWPVLAFVTFSFTLRLGFGAEALMRFIATLPAVLLLEFTISLNIGVATLWTQNSWGLGLAFGWVQNLVSGILLPMFAMPGSWQSIAYKTPFVYLVDAPIRATTGMLTLGELWLHQATWIIGLSIVAAILYRLATKRLRVNGG